MDPCFDTYSGYRVKHTASKQKLKEPMEEDSSKTLHPPKSLIERKVRQKRCATRPPRINPLRIDIDSSDEEFVEIQEPRFHSQDAKHRYETTEFHLMDCRYLNQSYFSSNTPLIWETIKFYHLESLMNCCHDINLDICKEFYVNLRPVNRDENQYMTTVRNIPIKFTPSVIRDFLGCRSSQNPYLCFPDVENKITGSFKHISINHIHEHYFGTARKPSRTSFHATNMSAIHYTWYRIILDCVLPIVTKGRAMIRLPHLIMMYALEQRLDIDIALHIFSSIVHFSSPVNGKLHMPFGHIITQILSFRSIDTSVGTIRHLSKEYAQLGPRHLKLAKIVFRNGEMVWIRGGRQGAERMDISSSSEEDDKDSETPAPTTTAPDVPSADFLDTRFSHLEEVIRLGFQNIGRRMDAYYREMREIREELAVYAQRQQEMYDMIVDMHAASSTPPPPPPADDA